MDGAVTLNQPTSLLHAAAGRVLASERKPSPELQLPLDPGIQQVAEMCLKCLAHIFTWCSPSLCVNSRLINVLFQYAALTNKSQVSLSSCFQLNTICLIVILSVLNFGFRLNESSRAEGSDKSSDNAYHLEKTRK